MGKDQQLAQNFLERAPRGGRRVVKGWLARISAIAVCVALFALGLAGPALAQEPVTLKFQYRTGEGRAEAVEAWIAEFEALHPNIKVEWYQPPSDYRERTLISWASGTGPDVTEIWGDFAQDYARAGVLLDLRRYVERDFTQEEIADFYPVAWQASYLHHGDNAGIQFRIPRYIITLVYYFNAEQIAGAGLETPLALDERGEWTYQAVREMARRLTVFSGNEITRYGFTTDTDAHRRMSTWMRAFGGDLFDPADPTRFIGHENAAVEAMTFLQEMIWQDQSTLPEFDPARFYTGGVALVEEGNHAVISRFDRNIQGEFAWDIAPAPAGRNGRQAYSGDDGFAIWRDTPHPDEAWEFVKFLTSKRGQEIAALNEGLAPVRRSALPVYQALAPHINLGAYMVNMSDASLPVSSVMVGDVAEIGRILDGVLEATMERNEKPYAQAIQEVAATISALAAGRSE